MRALGIDFGTKRVGLAVCDPMGILATPLKAIERTTRDALFGALLAVIEEYSIETVVVGVPYGMDGQETLTTRQAFNFAESLGRRTDCPIKFMDERLSSVQAEEELRAAGLRRKKKKQALDSQAATIILRTWLESSPS